jgi:hypothetical protein
MISEYCTENQTVRESYPAVFIDKTTRAFFLNLFYFSCISEGGGGRELGGVGTWKGGGVGGGGVGDTPTLTFSLWHGCSSLPPLVS